MKPNTRDQILDQNILKNVVYQHLVIAMIDIGSANRHSHDKNANLHIADIQQHTRMAWDHLRNAVINLAEILGIEPPEMEDNP